MRHHHRLFIAGVLAALLHTSALAQPRDADVGVLAEPGSERLVGFEMEFAGRGSRVVRFEEMPWENYRRLMEVVVEFYGGDPATIQRVDFTKPTTNLTRNPDGQRPLFKATWVDPRGRRWKIEPEYVSSTGLDGYEMVTPPLDNPAELEGLLQAIKDSGLVREGRRSGVHVNVDGRRLIQPDGNARALANLIMLHENMEPTLRRLFNPVRGGGHKNYFSRPLAMDHEELLKQIDRLPPHERTRERIEALFKARQDIEAKLQGADPANPASYSKLWKYHSLNLAKVLRINELHDGNTGVVEFRMLDLEVFENPEVHRLEAELYRALVKKAEMLAEQGVDVRYKPRARQPAGEDPALYNTPRDVEEAKASTREMLEFLGLDPTSFEKQIERTFVPRLLPNEAEFKGMLDALETGRVEHGGKPFTYGFELEGTGEGFARIALPKDPATRERWESMSDAQKQAYYRQVVGSNRDSVPEHFDLNTEKFPWLDKNWKVEGSGNWEIRSVPFESLAECTARMREVKKLTGNSGKGFHLHMRDNAPDWELLKQKGSELADFIERSANWVWLERARRLGTMTSVKSWSNARMTTGDVNNVSELKSSSRATVRVTMNAPSYVDLEIRGFTRYVDDIETLAKIYTNALITKNFGPWKHTDNVLRGGGQTFDKELKFVDHMERYLREVEGKTLTPEERIIFSGLQEEYSKESKGSGRAYSNNVAIPLLPWENEASLPESVRRDLLFRKEEYLRSLRFTADRVAAGFYGVDLNVISAEGLVEKLGVDPATAERIVAYRRSLEKGLPGDKTAAVARALVYATAIQDLSKLGALGPIDLNTADAETLRRRLGLDEAALERVLDHRDKHDVLDAMRRAGVPDAKILELIDRTVGLDLGNASVTAEKMVEALGISLETARKIVDLRGGHPLGSPEAMATAGLTPEEVEKVLEAATRPPVDVKTASNEALEWLVPGSGDRELVRKFRNPTAITSYEQLGSDLQEMTRYSGNSYYSTHVDGIKERVTIQELGSLSAAELVQKGVERGLADAIVELRSGVDVNNEAALERLLGSSDGKTVYRNRMPLDLATAEASLIAAKSGIDSDAARKLARYRDPLNVGRTSSSGVYRASQAANQLRELIPAEDLAKIELLSEKLELEKVTLEQLTGPRLGLDEATAKKVLAYRDAHAIAKVEGLVEAGLSQAEAERAVRLAGKLELETASVAELVERGLTPDEARAVLRTSGLDLAKASAPVIAERTGVDPAKAEAVVLHRDRRGFSEALGMSSGGDPSTLTRALDLRSATVEELVAAGLSPEAAARLVEARTAHPLNRFRTVTRAGLSEEARTKLQNGVRRLDLLNQLTAEELARVGGITSEEAKKLVLYRDGVDTESRGALVELLGRDGGKLFDRVHARDGLTDLAKVEADLRKRAAGVDLMNDAELSMAEVARRLETNGATVKRIRTYRDAHPLEGRADLELAGLKPEAVESAWKIATTALDLKTATAEQLVAAGLTAEEAAKLIEARSPHHLNRFRTVLRAGVSEEVRMALQSKVQSLEALRTLSLWELSARAGISIEDAKKVVAWRDGIDVSDRSALVEVLGPKGAWLHARSRASAAAIDLSKASFEELRSLGLDEDQSRKIVDARTPRALETVEVLAAAGLSPELAAQVLERVPDAERRARLSAAELAAEAGIPLAEAEKLVRHRDGVDVKKAEVLESLLGEKTAAMVEARAAGSRLQSLSVSDLSLVFGEEVGKKLASYRESHSLGSTPAEAAKRLLEAGVIREVTAEKLRRLAPTIDLEKATVEELTGPRLGLPRGEAEKIVALRDAHELKTVADLTAAGLTPEEAGRAMETAKALDPMTASVEELMARGGLTKAQAEELVRFREAAKAAKALDVNEITRQVRYKVKQWAQETELAEALLRSLLPLETPKPVETTRTPARPVEATTGIAPTLEGFGPTRPGTPGAPLEATRFSTALAGGVFEAVRAAALERAGVRLTAARTPGDRAVVEGGKETLGKLELEVVNTNDVLAERAGNKVRVSSGLLNAIHGLGEGLSPEARMMFQVRVLGLILAHEAAHASGIRTEVAADAEGLKILNGSRLVAANGQVVPVTQSEVREAVRLFDRPSGAPHVDGMFARLRTFFRYGSSRQREERLARATRGDPNADPLARWRRADGTVEWKRAMRDKALKEVGGLAHFGLALFLKEIAVVARSGDRARIEEFFDALMTTDFYKEYGLFVLGARAGEVAYSRYLERYVKPRFVNGVLKSNLVLATGIALPQLVNGHFSGKGFAITLGSLGLSSAAVKSGMAGIKWVTDLSKARETGALARTGLGASKFARLGGWFYTAAELAVVLYLAEDIEHRVHGYLDLRAARKALRDSADELVRVANDPATTPEALREAAEKHHAVWGDYRNFLYRELLQDEAVFAQRLEKVAREAKIYADKREAAVTRLKQFPVLQENIVARFGSLEKYAEHLVKEDEAKVARDVETATTSYTKSREEHMRAVYEDNRRGRPLLRGGDIPAAVEGASTNRMESYDDEKEVLAALQAGLQRAGKGAHAAALNPVLAIVDATRGADERLWKGDGGVSGATPAPARGTVGAVAESQPAYPRPAKVKVETRLRVRSAPNESSRILGHLLAGETIDVRGPAEGGWYKVDFEGKDAWVSAEYLALE